MSEIMDILDKYINHEVVVENMMECLGNMCSIRNLSSKTRK